MADLALCVLIVPVAILAPHLLAASVLPRRAQYAHGFARIRRPAGQLLVRSGAGPIELAVSACDLGRLAPRAGLPPLSPCPGAVARRQRPRCRSAGDAADQLRIHEALLAQRDGCWSACADRSGPAAPVGED